MPFDTNSLQRFLQISTRKRQADAGGHEKAATDAIVQMTRASQPAASRRSEYCPERVTDDYYRHEYTGQEQQLATGIGRIADKLRQKCRIEKQRLRVDNREDDAAPESAGLRLRLDIRQVRGRLIPGAAT
jgi:hypothetical protein